MFQENENKIIFKIEEEKFNLEDYLANKNISNRLFKKLYKERNILINGKFQRKDICLKKGDLISLLMEDEEVDVQAQEMDLEILYEDLDLLIINKKPYIVVHPTKSHAKNTLSNAIAYYFKKNNIKKKIRLVNRLDMNTSGILIVAKNPFAHQQMALQFEEDRVEKKYKVLVDGLVEKDQDIINLPILKDQESIKSRVHDKGQESITKYRVIDRYKKASLLEVQIITGRTHQIRVHLDYLGHPIIGDTLYNSESPYIKRQALHSHYLKIRSPRNGRDIEVYSDLPDDMKDLIERLELG